MISEFLYKYQLGVAATSNQLPRIEPNRSSRLFPSKEFCFSRFIYTEYYLLSFRGGPVKSPSCRVQKIIKTKTFPHSPKGENFPHWFPPCEVHLISGVKYTAPIMLYSNLVFHHSSTKKLADASAVGLSRTTVVRTHNGCLCKIEETVDEMVTTGVAAAEKAQKREM